jgi:diphosphomevalonate decarboxylase
MAGMAGERVGLVLDAWVKARAPVNIALIKYWGKAPSSLPEDANLPAVPSLSLSLAGLFTETWARFAPDAERDTIRLGGRPLLPEEMRRAVALLDRIRAVTEVASPFEIITVNHVPTAAGLASSASGMAALAAAAGRCAGLDPSVPDDLGLLSEIARIGSGSASRSVYGGWVAWEGRRAHPVAPRDHLPIAVVVAVVGRGRKAVGSRDAMNHTARTSPYYAGWVQQAHEGFADALAALAARDHARLFAAMERSTWRMHASAMAADPPVFYWQPASVAVLREVAAMRADGILCGATLDAGPHVKVFCDPRDSEAVSRRLTTVPGVEDIIETGPGSGLEMQVGDEPSVGGNDESQESA